MAARRGVAGASLAVVLLQIGLMDLSLSIDNVIAAVGLAPKDNSGDPVMWPIYVGVLIAILALQAIAPHAVTLLRKYPILEPTAFILIGYVGVLLIVEEAVRLTTGSVMHLPAYVKFAGILGIIWRLVQPLVRISMPIMRGVTTVVGALLWPIERLIEMF